jgi:hypothetical protein
MIAANELRIGNWVILNDNDFKDSGAYCIDSIDISVAKEEPKRFSPIPITHDILEKAGFAILENAGNWNNPEYTIYSSKVSYFKIGLLDGDFKYYVSTGDDFYSYYSPKITYLHQLENLYFALTGTELTINL